MVNLITIHVCQWLLMVFGRGYAGLNHRFDVEEHLFERDKQHQEMLVFSTSMFGLTEGK